MTSQTLIRVKDNFFLVSPRAFRMKVYIVSYRVVFVSLHFSKSFSCRYVSVFVPGCLLQILIHSQRLNFAIVHFFVSITNFSVIIKRSMALVCLSKTFLEYIVPPIHTNLRIGPRANRLSR